MAVTGPLSYEEIKASLQLTDLAKFFAIKAQYPERLTEWLRAEGANFLNYQGRMTPEGLIQLPDGSYWDNDTQMLMTQAEADAWLANQRGQAPSNIPIGSTVFVPGMIWQTPQGEYVDETGLEYNPADAQKIYDQYYSQGETGQVASQAEITSPTGEIFLVSYDAYGNEIARVSTGRYGTVPGQVTPMTEYQQADVSLGQQQLAAQTAYQQQQIALQQQQLAQDKQATMAQMLAQPASWLEYSLYSGQPAVVQPWMLPLMPEQYGLSAGQTIPGWQGIPTTGTTTTPYTIPGYTPGATTTPSTVTPSAVAPTTTVTPTTTSTTGRTPTTQNPNLQYPVTGTTRQPTTVNPYLTGQITPTSATGLPASGMSAGPQYRSASTQSTTGQTAAPAWNPPSIEQQIASGAAIQSPATQYPYAGYVEPAQQAPPATPTYVAAPATGFTSPSGRPVPEYTVMGGMMTPVSSLSPEEQERIADEYQGSVNTNAQVAARQAQYNQEMLAKSGMTQQQANDIFSGVSLAYNQATGIAPTTEQQSLIDQANAYYANYPELNPINQIGQQAVSPTTTGTYAPSTAGGSYAPTSYTTPTTTQTGTSTGLSGMPAMTWPSRQYQARMGPSALQQYYGYEQARTGAIPEETQWRLWSRAAPGGGNAMSLGYWR